MKIQLWSYNYDPEPTGIAPVSAVWAQEMQRRGHQVEVVAAHPHYPEPRWGWRARPYQERRDGIPVLRLPIWPGRDSRRARVRQELSFTLSQTLALPALTTPDVIVAVSPCFPALIPVMANTRVRRTPWVLWLQDLLPDGAAATGLIESRSLLRAARALERRAYRSADHIVVISETFKRNLCDKEVPGSKITRIYNSATRLPATTARQPRSHPRSILCMGNIGHSQGLAKVVRAFQANARLAEQQTRFVIAGTGVAAAEVRAAITTDRVEMLGLVSGERLDEELRQATLGVVTQRPADVEFNVPSKLMNYMTAGLPVAASVPPDSEVARIIQSSGGGWVTDAARPDDFAATVSEVIDDGDELARRGAAGAEFARAQLSPEVVAGRFEEILRRVTAGRA